MVPLWWSYIHGQSECRARPAGVRRGGEGSFSHACIKTLSRREQDQRLNLPDPGECQGKGCPQPPCSERDSRENPPFLSHCGQNADARRKLDVKSGFEKSNLSGPHISSLRKAAALQAKCPCIWVKGVNGCCPYFLPPPHPNIMKVPC